ncbi:TetR-like C-terminal domain-containing protein [Streptomyces sp. NPDC093085]|uniref:TetR-like C-terminal domain-containing protein n=1 Tax=Streptomyces sp. NPDC093085 TaxID=3155068 RepID=UPI00341D4EC9
MVLELLRAAVRRHRDKFPLRVPDTGSLRGDVVALSREMNERRAGLVALVSARLGTYYALTGTSPDDVRRELIGTRLSLMRAVLERAVARGEADPLRLTARVTGLPFDLFAHELTMTLRRSATMPSRGSSTMCSCRSSRSARRLRPLPPRAPPGAAEEGALCVSQSCLLEGSRPSAIQMAPFVRFSASVAWPTVSLCRPRRARRWHRRSTTRSNRTGAARHMTPGR